MRLTRRPGTKSGTHSATTMEAIPTRRPVIVSDRAASGALATPVGSSDPARKEPSVRQRPTVRPHSRIRSRPSAARMSRYPAVPAQNTTVVPNPLRVAGVVVGTMNRASSGSPATAEWRSRTASVSVASAASAIPAVDSSSRPGVGGTGGENRSASAMPCRPSCHR